MAGEEWSLAKAAEPYRGVMVTASFLPRSGHEAAIRLIRQFEQLTGIHVQWESIYYEQMHNALVVVFTSATPKFDIVLIDIVWSGEFAAAGRKPALGINSRSAYEDEILYESDYYGDKPRLQ